MKKIFASLLVLLLCALLAHAKSSYRVTGTNKNTTTVTLTLTYTGQDDYYIKTTSPVSKNLIFTFRTLAFNDFTFKFTDANKKRFEVPQAGVFPADPLGNFSFPIANSAVAFQYTENPFDFRIIRKQNAAVLFSTYEQNIIFSDHYLEIGTQVDSDYIYGIGERFQESFRKKDGKWTVFNRDRGQCIDRGTGLQTYGYYPFYLLRERGNLFHISYFRSSNALDVIKTTDSTKHYITYKVIGGVLDFRFFLGEQSPETTVEKLNFYSGRAEIPPFWGLGFHQCRWGYKNITYLIDVLFNYEKNGIPLDTIWNDIDYMIDYQDFTIDEKRFPLDQMNQILKRYRYIPIIDAGIKNSGSAYEEGLKRNVYVMDASGKKPYVGKVWPGSTTFVDFFHPNATQYWQDMLNNLYKKIQFSGVWLDMNELANFCDGACETTGQPAVFDYSKDLPYQPGSDQIESHTISLNATHYGNISEANVHAYSALLQTYATNLFLKSKNLKPFIITRSSTFGSSKYGFHWTGDNYASWQYLRGSIADNFNNQMFGFQMVGPDICGFGGNTNVELCARWFQLGALYTFARNHNDLNGISQQPYALGPVVLQAAKTNLKLRYSLLKYFYTLMVNKKGLGTIWRPLFFEFPFDTNNYVDEIADTQFLIGGNLMAAPILQPGVTSRKVYFPQTNWVNIQTGKRYNPGTTLITDVSLTGQVPLYIREGTFAFTQNTQNVVSTKQLDNRFLLSTDMRYDTRRSNTTTKIYESVGTILSIKDYNDDSLVELCFREGCNYVVTGIASISSTSRTLEIDVNYFGGLRLNQQIFFTGLNFSFGNEIFELRFESPVEITGPRKVTVTIPPPGSPRRFTVEAPKKSLQVE